MDEDKGWRAFALLFIFIGLVVVAQVDAEHEPICNTSYGSGKTTFVVSLQLHPEVYDCEYSWNNATNFVLANGVGHDDELVLSNTNTSLVVPGCINVTYELSCASGSKHEIRHRITCVANCTVKYQNLKIPISSSRSHYLPLIFGAVILVIIIIILMAVLFRKLRQKYSERRHQPVLA